jgi:hypothetical protein
MSNSRHKIRKLTDVEEAAIQVQISTDPDAAEATDVELAQQNLFLKLFPT